MHIPDGMLDTKTFTTLWASGAGLIGYASWWVRRYLDSNRLVLMSVLAALVFGLQMLNFPIAAGTSGHFSGGAAMAVIVGLWPASIIMTAVLAVQAVFFGDGGITTLGANIVNIGLVGPAVAALVYQLGQRLNSSLASKTVCSFLAAFLAVVASAAFVALELWASGRVPLAAAFGAMVGWHALIGIGEGVITAGLVAYIAKARPSLLAGKGDDTGVGSTQGGPLTSVVVVLALLAILAAGMSWMASGSPDGLEYVYFDTGLGAKFEPGAWAELAPFSGYLLPGGSDSLVSGVAAGIIGVVLTAALLLIAVTLIFRRRKAS